MVELRQMTSFFSIFSLLIIPILCSLFKRKKAISYTLDIVEYFWVFWFIKDISHLFSGIILTLPSSARLFWVYQISFMPDLHP